MAAGLRRAARHPAQPGLERHLLEHLQRLLHLHRRDHRQIGRAQRLEAAHQIHPFIRLAGVRVRGVGHELLALAQNLQPMPAAVRILEPRAGGLAPAVALGPVGQ